MYTYVYYIRKQYAAARACRAQNFPTFLGRLWFVRQEIN